MKKITIDYGAQPVWKSFAKKLSILLLLFFLSSGFISAQTTFVWSDDAETGAWKYDKNWSQQSIPVGGEIIEINNNIEPEMVNDLSNTTRFRIIFQSGATTSRKIAGETENAFINVSGKNPQIENQSTANHTIIFPVRIDATVMEINPLSGDITLQSTVDISNNQLVFYGARNGDRAQTVYITGTLQAGTTITGDKIVLKGSSTVSMGQNGNVTGNGRLVIESGSELIFTDGSSFSETMDIAIAENGVLNLNNQSVSVRSVSRFASLNGGSIELGINQLNPGTLIVKGGWSGAFYQNSISGTGNIVKQGAGEWVLYGNQTSTGEIKVEAGVLSSGVNLMASNIHLINNAEFKVTENIDVKRLTLDDNAQLNIADGKVLTVTEELVLKTPFSVKGTGEFKFGTSATLTYQSSAFSSTSDRELPETDLPHNVVLHTTHPDGIALHKNLELAGSLEIRSDAKLIVTPGRKLTVAGNLLNNATKGTEALIIRSDETGTGSLIHHSDNVPATIERYIKGDEQLNLMNYHCVSVPLTQGSNPVSGLFLDSYLFRFKADEQQWVAMGAPTDSALFVNQGYMIYFPGNNITHIFPGYLNNNDDDHFTASITTGPERFNLVPNPYPSAINWDAESGWTKTNITGTIWIWNAKAEEPYQQGGIGNYATYSKDVGVNGGTPIIPVGQSFFVKNVKDQQIHVDPMLNMNNNVRVHNDQGFFKEKENIPDMLRIKAFANNYSDETAIRFLDEATTYYDEEFDAAKMFGLGDAPQLYTISDDQHKLCINNMPYNDYEVISIPFGFEMEIDAEATLTFLSIDSFDPSVSIFLWDKITGQKLDIRTADEYTFNHQIENEPERFVLLFNSAVSVDEVASAAAVAYYYERYLHIDFSTDFGNNVSLQLFNAGGQLVYANKINPGKTAHALPDLLPGVYVMQLTGENRVVNKKILVE
jgi:autotransporter-associated beta strand protein